MSSDHLWNSQGNGAEWNATKVQELQSALGMETDVGLYPLSTASKIVYYGGSGTYKVRDGVTGEIVSYADASTAIQIAINALETAGHGSLYIASDFTTDTTITVEESNIRIFSDYASMIYTGSDQAIILGTASARKNRIKLENIAINGTDGATVGVEVLEADSCVVDHVHVLMSSGSGFKINGGATWASVNSLEHCISQNADNGVEFSGVTHSTRINGGYLFRSVVGVGSSGVYTNTDTDMVLNGVHVESFEVGLNIHGKFSTFIHPVVEACTTGILCDALAFYNMFINPSYPSCGTNVTDNGANNEFLSLYDPTDLKRIRSITTTSGGNLDIHLADSAGSLGLRVFNSGGTLETSIDSLGNIYALGGATLMGPINLYNYGSWFYARNSNDFQFQLSDAAGARYFDFTNSGGTVVTRVNSNGQITSYGGLQSINNGLRFYNDGTIINPKNGVDGTLSGTPQVVEITLGTLPYYFKVYPTKT